MSERDNPVKTYLSDTEDRALDDIVDTLGVNRASVARLAILNFLIEHEDKVCRIKEIRNRYPEGATRG